MHTFTVIRKRLITHARVRRVTDVHVGECPLPARRLSLPELPCRLLERGDTTPMSPGLLSLEANRRANAPDLKASNYGAVQWFRALDK